jgi:hypothetical protein
MHTIRVCRPWALVLRQAARQWQCPWGTPWHSNQCPEGSQSVNLNNRPHIAGPCPVHRRCAPLRCVHHPCVHRRCVSRRCSGTKAHILPFSRVRGCRFSEMSVPGHAPFYCRTTLPPVLSTPDYLDSVCIRNVTDCGLPGFSSY